jgi:sulfatase maturation enzyme AslB (radical SAM superfamily)
VRVPEVDIYATFRCNLRCRHCFVGDALDRGTDLPWDQLTGLLDAAARRWQTRQVAFLGGEPTLYPRLAPAAEYAHQAGLPVRIVSNGGKSLLRLLEARLLAPCRIAISVDGASAAVHDGVRGPGSFDLVMRSIALAREHGHSVSAVLSIGRHNACSVVASLGHLAEAGVSYVNIHYVTDRGFASADMILSPREWLQIRQEVESAPRRPRVRWEGTFQPPDRPLRCAVIDRSKLMFFPDSRVFQCTMYVGLPQGHSYTWNGRSLVPNAAFQRRYRASGQGTRNCPAMRFVNSSVESMAAAGGWRVGCIFDKEEIAAAGVGSWLEQR